MISGWWFGTWLLFSHIYIYTYIPIDFLIFFKMVIAPPTRYIIPRYYPKISQVLSHRVRG
jgi:hypothetical protein